MQILQESFKISCKVLEDNALFLQDKHFSSKNLERNAFPLQDSCKNWLFKKLKF